MATGRTSKLTEGVIEQICKYVKLRMKIKEIAEILGVHRTTLQKWIADGEKAKSGLKRQLVDAIANTKAELTADLSQLVFSAAFYGSETVTAREVMAPDGSVVTLKTTKKDPPNAAEARRILALMHPDRWAETQHIKYEWKESIENIGLDPKKVEDGFFKDLQALQESGDEVVIPRIEGKTV